MREIVLGDIGEPLYGRIRQLAERRGWELPQALVYLLERGLEVGEDEAVTRLEDHEAQALSAAVQALRQVPDDPGYALIGRLPARTADSGAGA